MSNSKFNIDLNELTNSYLVANTPTFFFKVLYESDEINKLIEDSSTESLTAEFNKIRKSEIKDLDRLVYAYAIYMALLKKNTDETNEYLNEIGNINFEWFDDLRNIHKGKITSTNDLIADSKTNIDPNYISEKTEDNAVLEKIE